MAFWASRLVLLACAAFAGVRSVRDRFVFGAGAAVLVALLTLADLLAPYLYFVTIAGASVVSILALAVAWTRERNLPAAHTQSRDLLWPFIGCATTSAGGLAITLLAHSLSEP